MRKYNAENPGRELTSAIHPSDGIWFFFRNGVVFDRAMVYEFDKLGHFNFFQIIEPDMGMYQSARFLGELDGDRYFGFSCQTTDPANPYICVYDHHGNRFDSDSRFSGAHSLDELENLFVSAGGYMPKRPSEKYGLPDYEVYKINFLGPDYFAAWWVDGSVTLEGPYGLVNHPMGEFVLNLEYLGEYKGKPFFAYESQDYGEPEPELGLFNGSGKRVYDFDISDCKTFGQMCEAVREQMPKASEAKSKGRKIYEKFEKAAKVTDVKSKSMCK